MKWIVMVLVMLMCMSLVAISQESEQPVVKKKVEAVYPKEALEKSLEGDVLVDVCIAKEGHVYTAMIKETSDEIFTSSVLDAIVKWEFYPLKNETKATIPFKFRLKK